jgi:ubiquinone/menaquinone biosynthesis C-methylase UbiE
MNPFDNVADIYHQRSLVQNKAGQRLIDLLKINPADDVLDVGCGTGSLTAQLRKITKGKVVGTDIAEGMLQKASTQYPDIKFRTIAGENLDYQGEFNVVYCNSTMQWFNDPEKAARSMHSALKKFGRLGVSCPGTYEWGPWIQRIVNNIKEDPIIKPVFALWRNPWFLLNAKDDYATFFEHCGLTTQLSEIDYTITQHSVEEAFGIYLSSAAIGFTSREFYKEDISDEYINFFNQRVRSELEKQAAANNGTVRVDFRRIYYIGRR